MAADERDKGSNEQHDIKLDEFIAKAVPDPKNPGDVVLVSGFLGASSEPERTRIYWDASLNNYVDVKTSDIVHSEAIPKEQSSGLGGSHIWLKRDAKVLDSRTPSPWAQTGRYFQGALMAAYGAQFGGVGAAGPQELLNFTQLCQVSAACNYPTPYITFHGYACNNTPNHTNICQFTPGCHGTTDCPQFRYGGQFVAAAGPGIAAMDAPQIASYHPCFTQAHCPPTHPCPPTFYWCAGPAAVGAAFNSVPCPTRMGCTPICPSRTINDCPSNQWCGFTHGPCYTSGPYVC